MLSKQGGYLWGREAGDETCIISSSLGHKMLERPGRTYLTILTVLAWVDSYVAGFSKFGLGRGGDKKFPGRKTGTKTMKAVSPQASTIPGKLEGGRSVSE